MRSGVRGAEQPGRASRPGHQLSQPPAPSPGPYLFCIFISRHSLILNQLRVGWSCCGPHPPGSSCLVAQWKKRVPSLSFQGVGSEMAQGPNLGDSSDTHCYQTGVGLVLFCSQSFLVYLLDPHIWEAGPTVTPFLIDKETQSQLSSDRVRTRTDPRPRSSRSRSPAAWPAEGSPSGSSQCEDGCLSYTTLESHWHTHTHVDEYITEHVS